jgi:hypothetical protein
MPPLPTLDTKWTTVCQVQETLCAFLSERKERDGERESESKRHRERERERERENEREKSKVRDVLWSILKSNPIHCVEI